MIGSPGAGHSRKGRWERPMGEKMVFPEYEGVKRTEEMLQVVLYE